MRVGVAGAAGIGENLLRRLSGIQVGLAARCARSAHYGGGKNPRHESSYSVHKSLRTGFRMGTIQT